MKLINFDIAVSTAPGGSASMIGQDYRRLPDYYALGIPIAAGVLHPFTGSLLSPSIESATGSCAIRPT